jgi:hypothetical protein
LRRSAAIVIEAAFEAYGIFDACVISRHKANEKKEFDHVGL